ncbi:DUF4097 family beta strand repeat-containing protein [Paenibacillus sp. NAIST15-1]|uniref:DUF4097 family beta strand repeat-containing protein n=1 Tax=Paenibacillus sp. NAIST15-1 TaxID=1605994 RepID=UPI00086A9EFF|nr:DUF4097 family beta strand repeat-containing protein [Paenibacillus sp. NAIST15-1]GAV13985.1 hypothetical protein PBN151_3923 [Paenibacillus sp. NAIST15-1]
MNWNRATMNMVGIVCIVAGVAGLVYYGPNQLFKSQLPSYEYRISAEGSQDASGQEKGADKTSDYESRIDVRELESIVIDADYGDVKVSWINDNKNMIELKGQAPEAVINRIRDVQAENGTLELNFEDNDNAGWLNINIGNIQRRYHEVIIHASENFVLDNLSSNVSAGAFEMTGGHIKRLEASSNLGRVKVKNVTGDFVKLRSDSGQVVADNVDAEIEASSSLGSVDLNQTKKNVQASANAGSISIVQAAAHPIDAEGQLGSVNIRVVPEYNGKFDLKTELGSVSAPNEKHGSDMVIKVRTEAGSIKIVEK